MDNTIEPHAWQRRNCGISRKGYLSTQTPQYIMWGSLCVQRITYADHVLISPANWHCLRQSWNRADPCKGFLWKRHPFCLFPTRAVRLIFLIVRTHHVSWSRRFKLYRVSESRWARQQGPSIPRIVRLYGRAFAPKSG